MAIRRSGVRRDSAVKLIDDLAGESPASADYPVGTVVISDDGAGDQTVGSPDVNVRCERKRLASILTPQTLESRSGVN